MPWRLAAFNGEIGLLADFINTNWKKLYAARGPYLLWRPELFAWQMLQKLKKADWDKSVVAYRDDEIVGCALGFPFVFCADGKKFTANWLSWVTISKDEQAGGHGLSFKLLDAYVEKSLQSGIDIVFGLSQEDQTSRYWQAYFRFARRTLHQYHETGFAGECHYYMKMLDAECFGMGDQSVVNLATPRLGGEIKIRPLVLPDVLACASIYRDLNSGAKIYRIWETCEWTKQLLPSVIVQTLVLEVGGEVKGFINYYTCEMWGGSQKISVACVAHFCARVGCPVEPVEQLLDEAGRQMRRAGIVAAILPNLHYFPKIDYAACGYYLLPETFKLFYGNFNANFHADNRGEVPFDNV